MLVQLPPDPVVKYKMGWATIAIIFILIAVNLVNIMVASVPKIIAQLKSLYANLKQKLYKKKEINLNLK